MSARTYGQYCSIARALDVVGDRWVLLIIRELLDGPKRYRDLQDGLSGIATDMLAARLKRLEADGLVARRTLEPPAASRVYELTDQGRRLEPVLVELARFGLPLLGRKTRAESFRAHWITAALRTLLHDPDHGDGRPLRVRFQMGSEAVTVRLAEGGLATEHDATVEPDVVVTAAPSTLARLAADPSSADTLLASGRVKVDGPPGEVASLRARLGLDTDT